MIMQALAPITPEGHEPLSEVFLPLDKTDFPERYLPKGYRSTDDLDAFCEG
jgi:hypothetical protein